MKPLFKSALLAVVFLSAPPAFAWDIEKMNAQIENTNVIVGGICSGTIINKEKRLVLTAYHCVNKQFTEVTEKIIDPVTGVITEVKKRKLVPLEIYTNKVRDFKIVAVAKYAVNIVGSDSDDDIALLQVIDTDYVPLAAVSLAPDTYKYRRGQKVYAVGNPNIEYDNSITEGIISSPERTVSIDGKEYRFFQHSASIIGGNSGGSILNDDGELIGTVSASLRGANIAFAVPISFTKEMLKKAGF